MKIIPGKKSLFAYLKAGLIGGLAIIIAMAILGPVLGVAAGGIVAGTFIGGTPGAIVATVCTLDAVLGLLGVAGGI